ncbi:MAG: hypothetical protein L6R41_004956 [Letrouitia leprolyta]|nr:MAG: hypothetical protein L6R41_004956 [Letrouitia leprolyta]
MFSLNVLLCSVLSSALVSAKCNADKFARPSSQVDRITCTDAIVPSCYRALFATTTGPAYTSNSAFCATYTTTINTQTTGFANKAIAPGCQSQFYRISSACSCNPTATTTTTTSSNACAPTPTINVVQNGGFECNGGSIINWTLNQTSFAQCSIYHVGDNSYSAFRCLQYNPGSQGSLPSTLTQNIPLTVGNAYAAEWRTYVGGCGPTYNGILRLRINGQVVSSLNACQQQAQYSWKEYGAGFTATANPTVVQFEWLSPGPDIAPEIIIDNVIIGPA